MGHNAEHPIGSGPHWLADLLEQADREHACVQIGCTTCGATPFRSALWGSADQANPIDPCEEIAGQLALVTEQTRPEALRMVINELNQRVGAARLLELSGTFAASPAGAEYMAMQAHSAGIAHRRADNAHRNSPAYAVEQAAERAARHTARLAAKAIRDAARNLDGEA